MTSITSNQADAGLFKKDKSNDIQEAEYNTADIQFKLRSENYLAERVYTITYTAYDASYNSATATAYVTVPYTGKISVFNGSYYLNKHLQLYPNPADDRIFINLELPASEDLHIKIYDQLGIEQYWDSDTNIKEFYRIVDTRNFVPGIYYLEIKTGSGSLIKPFIKN